VQINVMPDFVNVAMQLISTAILFLVVRKKAWGPMQEFLRKRQELVTKEITEAKALKAEADDLKAAAKSEIATARDKAKSIVEASHQQADMVKKQLLEEASLEAKRKLDKAASEIQLERKKVYSNIRKDIVDLAIASAENLIEKEIDPNNHGRLFDEFLEKVGEDVG